MPILLSKNSLTKPNISMYTKLIRPVAILSAILGLSLGMAGIANADTGPWQWNDISDKLSVRENRPVWASAYAHPYWFLTDGQELYTGGHVWKTDGAIVTDITAEVRNAGLNRVDDIVSDGQTIMFLKNVVSNTKNFEILTYKDGTWGYPAWTWQSRMYNNEAILSINGKDGIWMIVTNQGNVYRWKQSNDEFIRLTLPDNVKNNLAFNTLYSTLLYNVNHGSPAYHTNHNNLDISNFLEMLPVSNNNWLLMARVNDSSGNYKAVYYQYNNYNFTDISYKFNTNYTTPVKVASNGNEAILIYSHQTGQNGALLNTYENGYIKKYDGNSVINIVPNNEISNSGFSNSIVGNNGKSWMIISDKKLFRLGSDNQINYYGPTHDYFVTINGDKDGRLLLGGAVSYDGLNEPSSPLTAKLVRVDEGTTSHTPSNIDQSETIDTVKGSTNNINYWAWFEPNYVNHGNIEDPKYSVGAQSSDGIEKIELYINGIRQRICDGNGSKGNVGCVMFIESTAYNYGSNVDVNAVVTNSKGKTATVPVRSIRFYQGTTTSASDDLTANMTVSHNEHNLYHGQSSVVHVNASSPAGLSKIEYFLNGSIVHTCNVEMTYGSCDYTIYGSNYTKGSEISFNARVTSATGKQVWTWLGQYYIPLDDNYNNNNNNYYGISMSQYFDSGNTNFPANTNQTYNIDAKANNGLQKIEVYVNNSLARTCIFNRSYNTESCDLTLWSNNYTSYNTIPVYAKAYDYSGNQKQTDTLTLYRNNNNVGGTLNVWFDGNVSSQDLPRDQSRNIKFYGTAENGMQRLELYDGNTLLGYCSYNNVYGQQSCEKTIYANNYDSGHRLNLKAKVIDRYGNTAYTSTVSVNITGTNNNSTNMETWFYMSPSELTINKNESRTIQARAYAIEGLQKIDIYLNGNIVKTCNYNNVLGTQTCDHVIYANSYNSGSELFINVRSTDLYGRTDWSDSKTYTISGTNNNYATNVYSWLEPSDTNVKQTDNVSFKSQASDADGLDRIELWVNNKIYHTCYMYGATNGTCSNNIYGGNYSVGSNVYLFARAYDKNNNFKNADGITLNITSSGSSNAASSITTEVSPNLTNYKTTDYITYWANVTDGDGINRIEIYKNDTLDHTCYLNSQTSGSCSISFTAQNTNQTLFQLKTRVVDSKNIETWSSTKTIQIRNDVYPTDYPGTISVTTNAADGYTGSQMVTFTVNAEDANGIGDITLYVNARLVRTCTESPCVYTGGPYPEYNQVTYGANLNDSIGNHIWTGYEKIYKKD